MPFGIDDLALATGLSGALSAGSGLLGGLFGSSGQAAANERQMSFNSYQAQLNREWQEHMSSTAYVRAMTDMKNAGLNPILAANLGGASSGSGSAASASLGNPGAFMQEGITSAGEAVSKAAATKVALTQAEKDQSQVDLNKSTTSYTKSNEQLNQQLERKAVQDTATSAAQAANALSQSRAADAAAALSGQNAINAAVQRGVIAANVTSAQGEARINTRRAEDYEKYGESGSGGLGATIERMVRRLATPNGTQSSPAPSARGLDQLNLPPKPPGQLGPNSRSPYDPQWRSPNKWWN